MTSSPALSPGQRARGPFKRNVNQETESVASWEEKWYALGTENGTPNSAAKSTTNAQGLEGHGMQQTEEADDSGPGQSWRKLV